MSTAVAPLKGTLPALNMQESQLIEVLRNSLYPGAKDESIKLVIGYCKASGLDPMQKPVHIVPMTVKQKKTDGSKGFDYIERDVIMPGIGLYRVQAARSGEYGGMSEPEFGPMKTMEFTEEHWEDSPDGRGRVKGSRKGSVEYPDSCKVTVKRIVGDRVVEFTAVEYWIENYATAGRDSTAPNAMWKKRPRGQLAKCTSAQALRMAFPELGAQPTADELEGKTLDTTEGVVIEGAATHIPEPVRKSKPEPAEKSAEPATAAGAPAAASGGGGGGGEQPAGDAPKLSAGMKKTLRARMEGAKVTDEQFEKQFGCKVDDLPAAKVNDGLAWCQEMKEAAQA